MPALTLANVILYAAQAALLIGVLALMLVALRPSPAFRLAACRAVLVALLLLPFQGAFRAPQPAAGPMAPSAAFGALAFEQVDARPASGVSWTAIGAGVLAAGIGLRLLWLLGGLTRLARLTRGLPVADDSEEIADLQAELGTRARVYFVPDVGQPVTFGVAPARVLLPAAILDAPVEQRRAVLCHELLHVRRGDWVWVLFEEGVLALLWFHPAVWWLVGEQQLAREQVVDQMTVAATGARRTYMTVLFSAADAPSAPPLLAGFLRRRHLARRLVALAEEVAMSRVRIAVGGVLTAGVLVGSASVALAAWPLVPAPSAAQEQTMAFQPKGEGQLAVVHHQTIDVPSGLSGELTHATILVDLVVDSTGVVTAARPVSYGIRNDTNGAQLNASSRKALEGLLASAPASANGRRPFTDGASVIRDIDAMVQTASTALTQWRFEAPASAPAIARISTSFDLVANRATTGAPAPLSGFAGMAGAPIRTVFGARTTAAPPSDGTLRVGGPIRAPEKVFSVNPDYPQEARDARVQGVVIVEAKIGGDGSVAEAWVLRSIPLLDQAALDAVRQWRFTPTLLNGVPVPVIMTVTVNFSLR
jgi:TonB family protein